MVIKSELPLYCDSHGGFAGTIDLLLGTTIYDFKCTEQVQREAELQLLAYRWLCGHNDFPITGTKIVQLKGDGSYQLHDFSHLDDYLWANVMELYNWKMRRGIK